MRTGVSAEAGRGRAHRAAPQASPLVYTAREDPRQGLRYLRCGPPMPLTRGLRSSRGRRRSPLPLISERHSSCSGEAQSEEAACCGWAVTSLGWRPARRVGPRHPATPLGVAGGGEPWQPACPWDSGSPRAGWGPPAPPLPRPAGRGAAGWLPPCAASAPPPLGWGSKRCGNNTYGCSDKDVALTRGASCNCACHP